MKKIKILIIIAVLLFFISCVKESKRIILLDNFKKEKLTFDELPHKLQFDYREITNVSYRIDTLINYTNFKDIKLNNTSMTKDLFKLIKKGFTHNFVFGDTLVLRLNAKKGDPFIFYNNYFFYTEELILTKSNYEKSNYYRIDLKEVLGISLE